MYCKACGNRLGEPEDDLHDPDNLMEIVQGGVSNPDSAHLKAQDGARGPRLYCRPTGKVTTIVEGSPNGEGEGDTPNDEQERRPKEADVYEIQEEKSQAQLLAETVTNPSYGLNDNQIDEIKEWADIYDGRLPPDILEKVAANFTGVAKQTAALMREKYDAKLNKWIREQSQDEGGPPIGVMHRPPQGGRGSRGRVSPPEPAPEDTGPKSLDEVRRERRSERRRRAMERRQDALDSATEEAVKESVQELAHLSRDMRQIVTTILQAKAEKDPEWFFENIDILESLGKPSEARKRELEAMREGKSSVETEVDEALQNVTQEEEATPEREVPEEDIEDVGEDSAFEETFGDLLEEEEARV